MNQQRLLKLNNQFLILTGRREIWIAVGFTLFLIAFEAIYFQIDYLNPLAEIYNASGKPQLVLAALIIYLFTFVILTAVVWLSLVSRYSLRIIYFVILAIPLLVQYGYWNANQAFMALHDFDLTVELGAEAGPWKDHIGLITTYANLTALIPIGIYGILLMSGRPSLKRDFRLFLIGFYGILLLNTGIFWYERLSADHLGARNSYRIAGVTSWNGFTQVTTEALFERVILYYIINYYGPRDTISYVSPSLPQNNIVLIVDESVRADHLSLNGYERPTTPYLGELASKGLIYNWGVATSAATCSNQSVTALLTGVPALPDVEYQSKLNPTIFDYAKAMNYRTVLFDSEVSGPRYHFSEDDYNGTIDLFLGTSEFGLDYENDIKMAKAASDLLKDSASNFMVILKKGIHFPYNARYPVEESFWTPILPKETTIIGDREQLVNSYDNAILYNSNNFFWALLNDPKVLETTTFLYTSDHGQTLSDNGEKHTHCKNTQNEAAVPLLMITSQDYPVDEQYRASHHNVFATLLDLMGFPENQRDYDYAPSLLKAKASDSEPRYYLYGSLYGIGTYEVLKFD